MKLRAYSRIGFAALLLASGLVIVRADEPTRSQGAPIIFSPPSKSHTISSNLNELRKPQSPFHNLESDLQRPFELFDKTSESTIKPPRRIAPPPPNRKSVKDSLNQQAEEMYLSPESFDSEKADEAFFQLGEGPDDPYRRKSRNSLDRYYDRMERNHAAATNRPASNLFGEPEATAKTDAMGFGTKPNKAAFFSTDHSTANQFSTANTNRSGFSLGERPVVRPTANPFTRPTDNENLTHRTAGETRMENFKRLLEGPRYHAPASSSLSPAGLNYRSSSATAAITPATRTLTAPAKSSFDWNASAPKDPQKEFVKSAGLIGDPGKPQSLPEFESSFSTLSTPVAPAPVQKPMPPSTFKLPKRRI
jgi:hypothetical protein